jgi:hypothetical protein
MESRFGEPLADVRLHDDAGSAAAQRAAAFTVGNVIVAGAGRVAESTAEGRVRLAHELVHVLQQRRGAAGHRSAGAASAEREARTLGAAVAAGMPARVRLAAAPGAVQRDEGTPAGEGSLGPMFSPDAEPQLKLDPEIERWLLRNTLRWWLGTTLSSGGDAPTSLPSPADAAEGAEGAAQPADSPAAGKGSAGGVTPVPPSLPTLPLAPDLFAPLPPDRLFIEPDVGAIFSPFGLRGAPVGRGAYDVVSGIYRRNELLVRGLPDLRAIAPRFVRPLIPQTWRRDIAGALTGAAIDSSLKRDFPSPIEISDRAFEAMTGAGTTMIPLPSISFDLFGGGK